MDPPADPCAGLACPPDAARIARAFRDGHALESRLLPGVASGACYHLSDDLDARTAHHGLTYLDFRGDELYMDGKFSFFYGEDPYRDWDLAKARAELTGIFAEKHRVERHADFEYVDMNPGNEGDTVWRYWLRQSGDHLILVGDWGSWHRVLCELAPR
jgi:hypothetical protein